MLPSSMLGSLPVEDSYEAVPNGEINPEPILLEDTEILVNDFLSPTKLQELAGRDDLENVTSMEMIVNTSETTMGSFGSYLPRLKYLKLSNSVIPSVRDIGTSLSHLGVLWMACCGLQDVDGIASMVNLSELYLAYNDIEDISPLSFLENLEVLDLEGNQISDKEQFDYLSMLMRLQTLSISGNPVCQTLNKEALQNLERNSFQSSTDTMSYKEVIVKKLPQLKYIDDERCENFKGAHSHSSSDRPSTASLAASSHSQEDIDLINNAIKEGLITEEETALCIPEDARSGAQPLFSNFARPSSAAARRPMTATGRPVTAGPLNRSLRSPLSRPQTAASGRSSSASAHRAEMILQKASNAQRPSSSGSGDITLQDESSTLTFGDVICGNPIKALRARKTSPIPVLNMLQRNNSPTRPMVPQRPATAAPFPKHIELEDKASGSLNQDDDYLKDKEDIFSELRQWRAKHEERVSAIRSDVQILKLDNNTSSEEILLDSDATDSDADEILDLDSIPGFQDDNNNIAEKKTNDPKKTTEVVFHPEPQIKGFSSRFRTRSPPPKNLSPSSGASSHSPRSSPRSPRSPLFSSSQLDQTSVPVLRGSPKPRTPTSPSQRDGSLKHVPAPPKVGVPRPRTAADFRLRRSLVGSSSDPYVPLASPMALPQALSPSKRKTSNHVSH